MHPNQYNAAQRLLARGIAAAGPRKTAFIDDEGEYSYADLRERVDRCAHALLAEGLAPGERILLVLLDSIDFPTVFLGAIAAGLVPVPTNTLLPPRDLAFLLRDCEAAAVVVSGALADRVREAAVIADWTGKVIVSGAALSALLDRAGTAYDDPRTTEDSPCFWLYSSGSTGKPKGAIHRHGSLLATAELFAAPVLELHAGDVLHSAAKLFFAYGLGNALTFPLAVGATSVLSADRPTAASVTRILRERRPTIFCGVPTLYAALLQHAELPRQDEHALRLALSAGEALPQDVGRAFLDRTGVEIIDGLGSTEMLHIFLSTRPGTRRFGTTGQPVPGYRVRIVDEQGKEVARGEPGELLVSGRTAALGYWNNDERTRATFVDGWVRTGDKYRQNEDGDYVHLGRNDDMLKVGGIWVSPTEVEVLLSRHPAVRMAAVIGRADDAGLIKPKAFVVVAPGVTPSPALATELQDYVKSITAPYKYPRWIEFLDELPMTATGKVQRHVLRARSGTGGKR